MRQQDDTCHRLIFSGGKACVARRMERESMDKSTRPWSRTFRDGATYGSHFRGRQSRRRPSSFIGRESTDEDSPPMCVDLRPLAEAVRLPVGYFAEYKSGQAAPRELSRT